MLTPSRIQGWLIRRKRFFEAAPSIIYMTHGKQESPAHVKEELKMNYGYRQWEGNSQGNRQARGNGGCQCAMPVDRAKLLWDIQRTDFLINDLQLYLDMHPDCGAALEDFNSLSQLSMELKEQYHQVFGPIINNGYQSSEFPWQWMEEPWPWQKNFMTGR